MESLLSLYELSMLPVEWDSILTGGLHSVHLGEIEPPCRSYPLLADNKNVILQSAR